MNLFSAEDVTELEVKFQPFKSRTIENIRVSTRQERIQWLKNANYKLFNLHSDQIMIDLITDSGNGALSYTQTSNLITGDETYAGAKSFYRYKSAIQHLTGYKHVYTVHQGRAAERIIFSVVGSEGKIIANNSFFDKTRLNVELTKCAAVDLVCDEGKNIYLDSPFKGNMDIQKL